MLLIMQALYMDYLPHGSFIPHSPLSYSTSYSPSSPFTEQHKQHDETGSQRTACGEIVQPNKSILKNPTLANPKEQRTKINPVSNKDTIRKTVEGQTRKETLKTVAFGLTTRLEDTVLAKEGKNPATNKPNKMVIFSQEAHSLHKLIMTQQTEIDGLRKTITELVAGDSRQRSEAREQMNIIADLSSRLMEMERKMSVLDREHSKEIQPPEQIREYGGQCENDQPVDGVDKLIDNNCKTDKDKRMVLKQHPINAADEQHSEEECLHLNQQFAKLPIDDASIHRNEILQRLDQQMRKNPYFENRIKSMLRVWTDDVSSPVAAGGSILDPNRGESAGGTSMVVRVTTQRQELFYSSSPSRTRRAQQTQEKNTSRRQFKQSKPIVTELSEEGIDHFETAPNMRRSDHCTDDAEFFQDNDENQLEDLDAECIGMEAQNRTNNTFRRRKREATSAIRNKYK